MDFLYLIQFCVCKFWLACTPLQQYLLVYYFILVIPSLPPPPTLCLPNPPSSLFFLLFFTKLAVIWNPFVCGSCEDHTVQLSVGYSLYNWLLPLTSSHFYHLFSLKKDLKRRPVTLIPNIVSRGMQLHLLKKNWSQMKREKS